MFKKQTFNNSQLALLFQAFLKGLFVRPEISDISSEKLKSGMCLYFKADYYDRLKTDILGAYSRGKFFESNASTEWVSLMETFLEAQELAKIDEDLATTMKDYYTQISRYWPN